MKTNERFARIMALREKADGIEDLPLFHQPAAAVELVKAMLDTMADLNAAIGTGKGAR